MPTAPTTRPQVSLIAAVALNGAIGAGNQLLWHEPEDRRHFRRVTMGCPVIMGRKTWESLPERFRPLPGRRNLVLSTQSDWQAAGAERQRSLSSAIEALASGTAVGKVFVIGGGQVYALALPLADELVLTEIDADLAGDTYFPTWNRADFEVAGRSAPLFGEGGIGYRFVSYRRRR